MSLNRWKEINEIQFYFQCWDKLEEIIIFVKNFYKNEKDFIKHVFLNMTQDTGNYLVDKEQSIRDKLKTILENPDFRLFELTDFCVAKTKGRLTISKDPLN